MNNWNTLQVTLSIEFQPSSAGRASEEIYSHPRTEIWQHKVVNQQSSMPLRYQIRPHVINDEVFNGLLLLYAGGEFGSRENQIATIDFEINLKETNLFVSKDCNISYNTCLTVVMELLERTDENGKKEYKKWERNMAERVQQTQTLEERMSPLREIINQLKNRQITSFSEIFPQYSPAELTAALALFEEYELLKLFLKSNKDKDSCLNSHVRSQFAWWQPTPLYFITGKNQQAMMKDCCKMLRFLQQHGANPNIAAEDGSTPLWNQTTKNGSVEVLKTLLEIGADPNGLSHEDECDFYPLASCLLPDFDKDGNSLPYEADALEKAKLLLEHGADPNLAIPELSDEPPLVMAIIYGKGSNILPIINLLLEKGANPDFVDSEGKTPLQIATENNLPEVMQLLLKTPFLKITVDDEYTEEYTKNDILHFNYLSDFDVRISERTATSFKGSLYYDSDHNDFPSVYETFAVDAENPVSVVNTGIMTISRMENYKFKFELLALENPKLPVSQELSEIEKQQTPPMPEKLRCKMLTYRKLSNTLTKRIWAQ
ncbi:MAG: ankyrin repeat domain-containing protein [Paludibacter sp.]|jgi:ankyrin repeat protein|nr:ankyrin repeat domain-containing protein [Paludibacter sp.]